MWTPTHVQITVHKARNLKCKGKGGSNDSYVIIGLGSEKFQTSIQERTLNPEWQEECELSIPERDRIVKLCVYHRNLITLDDFVGHVDIALQDIQVYERPKRKWYSLKAKPGSKKADQNRGELEVTATFLVQQKISQSQSSLSMERTTKKSLSVRNLANSFSDRLTVRWPSRLSLGVKSPSKPDNISYLPQSALQTSASDCSRVSPDACGGLETDFTPREHEQLDLSASQLAQVSSYVVTEGSCVLTQGSCMAAHSGMVAAAVGSSKTLQAHHNRQMDFVLRTRDTGKCHTLVRSGGFAPKLATYELHELDEYKRSRQQRATSVGDEELLSQLKDYEREDLLRLVLEQHTQLLASDTYARDLEDYIDNLLVKVMETYPKILQNPYVRPANICNINNSVAGNSSAVPGIPSSATLPAGVYVANQLNKSTAKSDASQSKVNSNKGKANRIQLFHVFSKRS